VRIFFQPIFQGVMPLVRLSGPAHTSRQSVRSRAQHRYDTIARARPVTARAALRAPMCRFRVRDQANVGRRRSPAQCFLYRVPAPARRHSLLPASVSPGPFPVAGQDDWIAFGYLGPARGHLVGQDRIRSWAVRPQVA
jgi:hypothetical protein